MTDREMQEVYKDLGAVCEKHKLRGLAGLWISPDSTDNTFAVFDPTDSLNGTFLKHIVVRLNTMLRDAGWENPTRSKGLTNPDSDGN